MTIVPPGSMDSSMQLDINKTRAIVCSCGNHTFIPATFLRELSALMSPTGKAAVIPVPTFACNACGAVPDQVVPPFLKAEAQVSLENTGKSEAAPVLGQTPPTITKGHLTLLPDN